MYFSEFMQKEVLNVNDGCKLGYTSDLEFCEKTGRIKNIIIINGAKIMGIFGNPEIIKINYEDIVRVGDDLIMVSFSRRRDIC